MGMHNDEHVCSQIGPHVVVSLQLLLHQTAEVRNWLSLLSTQTCDTTAVSRLKPSYFRPKAGYSAYPAHRLTSSSVQVLKKEACWGALTPSKLTILRQHVQETHA
jgi:hypothetical protein